MDDLFFFSRQSMQAITDISKDDICTVIDILYEYITSNRLSIPDSLSEATKDAVLFIIDEHEAGKALNNTNKEMHNDER